MTKIVDKRRAEALMRYWQDTLTPMNVFYSPDQVVLIEETIQALTQLRDHLDSIERQRTGGV